jgi:hypothetical protein
MSEFFFSVALDKSRTLCVAPLTDQCITNSGQELNDISGYFLFEKSGTGDRAEIEILAQATSEEAAFRLRQLLRMT